MLEAYKNFWLGYLDFYGRTKRSDYWWVVLINGVIGTLDFPTDGLTWGNKSFWLCIDSFHSIYSSNGASYHFYADSSST